MSKEKTQYETLLEELAKAMPAGEPDGDEGKPAKAAAGDEEEDEEEDDGAGEPTMKALKVTIDGKEQEAFDALPMLKSLTADSTRTRKALKSTASQIKQLTAANQVLLKSVTALVSGMQAHAEVGAKVDELAKSIEAIGNAGRGRKSVTVVLPDLGSGPKEVKPAEFMAKAQDAMKVGRITGLELAQCEARIHRGEAPADSIVRKVLA